MKFLSRFYIFIIFAILYAPILVVILFSFNASGNLSTFSGFTFAWYKELFRDGQAIEALKRLSANKHPLCGVLTVVKEATYGAIPNSDMA